MNILLVSSNMIARYSPGSAAICILELCICVSKQQKNLGKSHRGNRCSTNPLKVGLKGLPNKKNRKHRFAKTIIKLNINQPFQMNEPQINRTTPPTPSRFSFPVTPPGSILVGVLFPVLSTWKPSFLVATRNWTKKKLAPSTGA